MTLLLELEAERTLDALVERIGREAAGHPDSWAEAWVFEDASARREAGERLARRGVRAVFRSAYKPLLHVLVEELDLADIAEIEVRFPVDPRAPELRFRLEAYPLAGLVPVCRMVPDPAAGLTYRVELVRRSGSRERHEVFAPNLARTDHLGETVLRPCGWLRLGHGDGAARQVIVDEAVTTDFESLFDAALTAIAAAPWPGGMPWFERLLASVEIPVEDTPALGFFDEAPSLREALHEDLYFSGLELFQRRAGQAAGSRDVRPGQIVPEVRHSQGRWAIRVETAGYAAAPLPEEPAQPLERADKPLTPKQIAAELAALGGEAFAARSFLGRPIGGIHIDGGAAGVLVTAGQHANETSGVVGALRAAHRLKGRGGFAVVPLENPDGYDLHRRLRRDNPRHMHHAARYTALGDDLEYRSGEPLLERAARLEGLRRTSAVLHLNLHGYPAHEWTRPLTGYVPRGFELWTVPKGHFLMLRHRPGLSEQARVLAEHIALTLSTDLALVDLVRRQVAAYEAHAGTLSFDMVHGIPCLFSERADQAVPLQLVTEYPDETIEGDAFRLAHETQMRTVLAAVDAIDGPLAAWAGDVATSYAGSGTLK